MRLEHWIASMSRGRSLASSASNPFPRRAARRRYFRDRGESLSPAPNPSEKTRVSARSGSCNFVGGARTSADVGDRAHGEQLAARPPARVRARARGSRPVATRGCGLGGHRLGFTILELVIVLMLASLAATAAIPAYFARSEVTLDNATRVIVDDLRQAQIRAVYRGAPVEVEFEPDGDGYCAFDRGADPTSERTPTGIARRYSPDAVFEGVRISAVELGSQSALRFEADGSTRSSGRITLCYRGDARTVTIEPTHGTVRAPELETAATQSRL
jgi:prepilin-type N-terminal cleavage/methylation domain-containing protein